MRPLNDSSDGFDRAPGGGAATGIEEARKTRYEVNRRKIGTQYHSRCVFAVRPPVPSLEFRFAGNGCLYGKFVCDESHQGYDGMAHGGIIAAVADAAMVQCLMGHGLAGVTTELTVRYRRPVALGREVAVSASIEKITAGCLYSIRCEMWQERNRVVQAAAKFFHAKPETHL